jgi:hypothetical protein
MFRELSRRGCSAETQMINSTHIKAHRSAAVENGGAKSADRTLTWRAQYGNTGYR